MAAGWCHLLDHFYRAGEGLEYEEGWMEAAGALYEEPVELTELYASTESARVRARIDQLRALFPKPQPGEEAAGEEEEEEA